MKSKKENKEFEVSLTAREFCSNRAVPGNLSVIQVKMSTVYISGCFISLRIHFVSFVFFPFFLDLLSLLRYIVNGEAHAVMSPGYGAGYPISQPNSLRKGLYWILLVGVEGEGTCLSFRLYSATK